MKVYWVLDECNLYDDGYKIKAVIKNGVKVVRWNEAKQEIERLQNRIRQLEDITSTINQPCAEEGDW